ncbi:hypothetical protein NP493_1046g00033 [Ridgeia piscesae]|uniref:Uncharacterized protein n=1 Tax=Ridgeia piscesae TaxID=27915 RepID=A0AAD9KIZ1_RIDPI|nr:hypothetical protein NP493_1046g00033 [Ridgeia piscesae]
MILSDYLGDHQEKNAVKVTKL